MSEWTKTNIRDVDRNLGDASNNLEAAKKAAEWSTDKKLVKKIDHLSEQVKEVRKDLQTKLEPR